MSSISRQLPNSNVTRMSTLDDAKLKSDALDVLLTNFLTGNTKTRLANIQSSFRTRYDVVPVKKQAMVTLTNQKSLFAVKSQRVNSHFIQVFNLAVERGIFPAADRAFYKLDVSTGFVPEMVTDAQIIQVGKDLIKGEADRVAAGGAAMAMPAIAEVTTDHNNLLNILMPHSAAVDAHDTAQEALDALNTEADAVIKKVADEVDTFHNEEEPSSQRQNAEEWGIKFITVGSPKKVTGFVLDSVTNQPIVGAKIFFENGNKTVISGADGAFELTTTLMGQQNLLAESDLHNDYSAPVTLVENEDLEWNVMMVPMV